MAGSVKILSMLGVVAAIALLFSCEHRPLEDPSNVHYVRVYIDENIKNVTYGFYNESRKKPTLVRPRVLRLVLADPTTGKVCLERYLQTYGEDERGYYVDGYIAAEAGDYNLMIYNFATERTKIRNEGNFFNMEAYTSPVSDHYYQYFQTMQNQIDKKLIRYCPDHLWLVTSEPVVVGKSVGIDTLRSNQNDFFVAKTVAKSYYLQLKIKGFEYVSTAVSLLSGMAGTMTLSSGEMVESDAVNIFFDMDYAEVERSRDGENKTAVLYSTFNTFGKLPNEQSVYTMNFEFTRTDGSSQVETIDVTSMFDEPLVKEKQWILIDKEIVITPTIGGGGGLKPGVDEWGDEWCDVQL